MRGYSKLRKRLTGRMKKTSLKKPKFSLIHHKSSTRIYTVVQIRVIRKLKVMSLLPDKNWPVLLHLHSRKKMEQLQLKTVLKLSHGKELDFQFWRSQKLIFVLVEFLNHNQDDLYQVTSTRPHKVYPNTTCEETITHNLNTAPTTGRHKIPTHVPVLYRSIISVPAQIVWTFVHSINHPPTHVLQVLVKIAVRHLLWAA